jgi:sec-independent protein translocase protein TatC
MPLDQMGDGEEKEMSFLDHLEELRWHLMRGFAVIFILMIAAFIAKDLIFHTILFGPSRPDFWSYQQLCRLADILNSPALCISELPFTLQSRLMTGQFVMHITASFVAGFVVGFPYFFWEIWRFIRPGLQTKERRAARGATFSVSFLFMLGITFGYFVVTPISVYFLSSYQIHPTIVNEFDITSYISTIIMLVVACGVLFQLPVVVYFLTKAGIIGSATLKKYRRHAIVVIFILGAMLTPPDPFSQILLALPLLTLYQFSILIAKRIEKRAAKEQAKR